MERVAVGAHGVRSELGGKTRVCSGTRWTHCRTFKQSTKGGVSCRANTHFWEAVLQDPSRTIKIFIPVYPIIPLLETFYKKRKSEML